MSRNPSNTTTPWLFEFLRSDIRNVEDFFVRQLGNSVSTLGNRRLWDFVTNESVGVTDERHPDASLHLLKVANEWLEQPPDSTSDAVFMSSFKPRTLAEVYDPERDVDLLLSGGSEELIYARAAGIRCTRQVEGQSDSEDGEDGEEDEGTATASARQPAVHDKQSRGFRHEDKEVKRVRLDF